MDFGEQRCGELAGEYGTDTEDGCGQDRNTEMISARLILFSYVRDICAGRLFRIDSFQKLCPCAIMDAFV